MRLMLMLTTLDGQPAGADAQRMVDGTTLTIGRGPMNDWVLHDPNRYLSKNHCIVEADGGGYRLIDTSTNGTFLNDADTAVGRGGAHLSVGDRIRLGPYEITVQSGDHLAAPPAADDPFGDLPPPMDDPFGTDPFDPNAASLAPPSHAPRSLGGRDPGFGNADDPLAGDEGARDDPFGLGPADPPGLSNRDSPFGPTDRSPPRHDTDDPFGVDAPLSAAPPPPPPDGGPSPFGADDPAERPDAAVPRGARNVIPEDFDFLAEPAPLSDPLGPAQDDHLPSERAAFVPPDPLRRPDTGRDDRLPADWADERSMAPARPEPRPPPGSAVPPPEDDDLPFDLGPAKVTARGERMTPEPAPPSSPPAGSPPAGSPPAGSPPSGARPDIDAPPAQRPMPAPPRPQPLPPGADPWAAFLAGMGVDPATMPPDRQAELAAEFGAALRAALQGLVELLQVRASLKEQFRAGDRTMLRATENNPLKFVLDADQAIDQLLKPRRGFLSADMAVDGGFKDIKAHLLAEVAGLQVALAALIGRFDPATLQRRLEAQSVWDNLVPAARKARYWELFVETYDQIAREAEDDFNGLFGREFAQAYDEQMKKL